MKAEIVDKYMEAQDSQSLTKFAKSVNVAPQVLTTWIDNIEDIKFRAAKDIKFRAAMELLEEINQE